MFIAIIFLFSIWIATSRCHIFIQINHIQTGFYCKPKWWDAIQRVPPPTMLEFGPRNWVYAWIYLDFTQTAGWTSTKISYTRRQTLPGVLLDVFKWDSLSPSFPAISPLSFSHSLTLPMYMQETGCAKAASQVRGQVCGPGHHHHSTGMYFLRALVSLGLVLLVKAHVSDEFNYDQ